MKTATRNPISSELSHTRTSFMVKLALMVAIIFVMAFSPLGYLRTPGLTITFLTVPVAVGAIILGPTAGATCGAAFGLTSVVMALTGGSAFSAALMQINPFGLLFTCLVPRILEGWICGLIFQLVKKFSKNGAFIVASLSCPLLNTLFFMSSLVLFFYNTEYIQGLVTKLGATNPLIFVILFVLSCKMFAHYQTMGQVSTIMRIPMNIVYSCVPFGLLIGAWHYLVHFIQHLHDKPEPHKEVESA